MFKAPNGLLCADVPLITHSFYERSPASIAQVIAPMDRF